MRPVMPLERSHQGGCVGLLVRGFQPRQVVRQYPSRCTGTHQRAQGINNVAQPLAMLRGFFGHQGQIGGDKGLSHR
jgi:hypothetical protein